MLLPLCFHNHRSANSFDSLQNHLASGGIMCEAKCLNHLLCEKKERMKIDQVAQGSVFNQSILLAAFPPWNVQDLSPFLFVSQLFQLVGYQLCVYLNVISTRSLIYSCESFLRLHRPVCFRHLHLFCREDFIVDEQRHRDADAIDDLNSRSAPRHGSRKQHLAVFCLCFFSPLLLCMPAFSTCVLSSSFHLPFLCCYLFSFSFLPFHFSFLTPAVPTTAVGLRISASGASASVPFPATPLPSSHQESMRTCRSSLQVQCSFSHFLVTYSSLIAYASIQHNQHN